MTARTRTTAETRTLRVDLSRDEVAEYADQLAQATQEEAQVENERKAVAATFKQRSEEVSARKSRLASLVSNKCDWRPVKCSRVLNYQEGTVSVYRDDTGERIERRSMTEDEAQTFLPFDDPEEDLSIVRITADDWEDSQSDEAGDDEQDEAQDLAEEVPEE